MHTVRALYTEDRTSMPSRGEFGVLESGRRQFAQKALARFLQDCFKILKILVVRLRAHGHHRLQTPSRAGSSAQ